VGANGELGGWKNKTNPDSDGRAASAVRVRGFALRLPHESHSSSENTLMPSTNGGLGGRRKKQTIPDFFEPSMGRIGLDFGLAPIEK